MDFPHLVYTRIVKAGLLPLVLCTAWSGQLWSQDFVPVDFEGNYHELDLAVASSSIGAMLIVSIQNKEQVDVACRATFHNGPQIPIERRLVIKAEKGSQVTVPLDRVVTRVRVNLDCDKQQAAESSKDSGAS